tara:strand:- start:139 stop:492 length:354 start_codon:yes stop_codon:yes gene_type:complete
MELLTDEIKKALPELYTTEEIPSDQKEIICKFFNPVGAGTWYVVEGMEDPVSSDWLFFGLVDLLEKEWGYFTLSELQNIKLPFGMSIERDIHWGKDPDGLNLTQIQDVTKVNFARYC